MTAQCGGSVEACLRERANAVTDVGAECCGGRNRGPQSGAFKGGDCIFGIIRARILRQHGSLPRTEALQTSVEEAKNGLHLLDSDKSSPRELCSELILKDQ